MSLWSFRSSLSDRVGVLWGNQGDALVWLAVAVAWTFVLGLALQLIALRTLSGSDYSDFVLALGISNVASAIAAAIQPVVAARAASGRRTFLPFPGAVITPLGLAAYVASVAALAPTVGVSIATLAVFQIPLHAVVGVGLGNLQAERSFKRMAICTSVFAFARVAVVASAVSTGSASSVVFVFALPTGLVATIVVLLAVGGYRGVEWRGASDVGLLAEYGLWAAFAWMLNADAIYARVFLPATDSARYAVAITLGRQPLYAVAPIVMILLPITLGAEAAGQRRTLHAILIVSVALSIAAFSVLGARPDAVVSALTGHRGGGYAPLVRGYALIGSLAALVTLELTFLFALFVRPSLFVLGAGALATLGVVWISVNSGGELLIVQGIVVGLLALWFTCLSWRATRLRTTSLPTSA
jgi:hypothetical protein